jgi:hypothetical protein
MVSSAEAYRHRMEMIGFRDSLNEDPSSNLKYEPNYKLGYLSGINSKPLSTSSGKDIVLRTMDELDF